jgi:hypothetical protein
MTKGKNLEMVDYSALSNPDFMRPMLYKVHIYSVSERRQPGKPSVAFEVSRPGLNISLLTIRPKEKADAYIKVAMIPHPWPMPYVDQMSGEVKYSDVPGQRAAMDICNPNNRTLDQDVYIDPAQVIGDGDNLNQRGVFWSLNDPPTEEEVSKAVQRMEAYYQGLLDRAAAMEMSDKAGLEEALRQNPDYGVAAEYFGREFSWHRKYVREAVLVECPNCGEKMKHGAAFHKSEALGVICVNDWDRAIAAGVKKADERPGADPAFAKAKAKEA